MGLFLKKPDHSLSIWTSFLFYPSKLLLFQMRHHNPEETLWHPQREALTAATVRYAIWTLLPCALPRRQAVMYVSVNVNACRIKQLTNKLERPSLSCSIKRLFSQRRVRNVKKRWCCTFLCQRTPRVCLWNSFIKASQQFHTDLPHFHLTLMLSHLELITVQTTESDCADVHIFSPRRSVSFWWWSVRRDKTPCSRFWVICVFHWLPHSEGSTFQSSHVRSHHTFEFNKPPHKHKPSIVYESTIKKGKSFWCWGNFQSVSSHTLKQSLSFRAEAGSQFKNLSTDRKLINKLFW